MLLASVLYVATYFITISGLVQTIMLGLPVLFYLFTFLDLYRTSGLKASMVSRSRRAVWLLLAIGILYQLVLPVSPFNFALRNRPEIFELESNGFAPIYSRGDLLSADRLAYRMDVFFLDRPIFHTLPARYDIIRFEGADGRRRTGIVVGRPGEDIEIVDGVIVTGGMPDLDGPPSGIFLAGNQPPTLVPQGSLLVAELQLNSITNVHEVPFASLVGRVERIF